MPAMFKANERCYDRTFGLYGLEALNHRSELKILWDTFRSQIAELWFPYDRRIANDRRWSQTIAEDRTWFYLLRSSAIVCDHDRTIAGDRRSVFPYDRRRSQNFLRSYGNQLKNVWGLQELATLLITITTFTWEVSCVVAMRVMTPLKSYSCFFF